MPDQSSDESVKRCFVIGVASVDDEIAASAPSSMVSKAS